MKNLLYCMLIISIVLTQACKKKKDAEIEPVQSVTPITPVTYTTYSSLKVGNYWIYQQFSVDPAGIQL